MKQASLRIKTHISNVNIINNNNIERHILNIMILSFGTLTLLYILFLGNMVFNIVERRNLEKDVRVISNEVQALELDYLSMSGELDLDLSRSMGFKEITKSFAIRKALSLGNDNLGNINSGNNEI